MNKTILSYFKNLSGFKKTETQNFDVMGHEVPAPVEKTVAVKKAKKPRAKKSKN